MIPILRFDVILLRMKKMISALFVFLFLWSGVVHASIDKKDADVIMRIASLVHDIPKDSYRVAVFQGAEDVSESQVFTYQKKRNKSKTTATFDFVTSLPEVEGRTFIYFFASDMDETEKQKLTHYALKRGILVISNDAEDAKNGISLLAISRNNGPSLYMNMKLYEESGLEFDHILKFLAKRVGG